MYEDAHLDDFGDSGFDPEDDWLFDPEDEDARLEAEDDEL